MVLTRFLVACVALALLAGCATFSDEEITSIQLRGVPAPLVRKLQRAEVLTPPEIIALTKHRLPISYMIRHIDAAGVDYLLTRQDAVRMRRAGVPTSVIEVTLEECDKFAERYAEPAPVPYDFWWADSIDYRTGIYYDHWW